MKYRSIVVVNDCCDDATAMRQTSRICTLTGISPSFVGVSNFGDLEAAGNIIDALDSFTGLPGVVVANAAPRHGTGKKWPNGTPFCYVYAGDSLIVSTIQGSILSLVKKLGLATEAYIMDVPTVGDAMAKIGKLDEHTAKYLRVTQFRSFDFEPRVVGWLLDGVEVPAVKTPFSEMDITDVSGVVWLVDNFGNCKTTMLPEDVGFEVGKKIKTSVGELTCFEHLKDVPNDEKALIIGSSGIDKRRFLEVVIQGKSAAKIMNISVGTKLI